MTPRCLFFDLDDTLVPQETSVLGALEDTCRLVSGRCQFDIDQLLRFVCEGADRLWREMGYSAHVDQLGIDWWEGLWGRFDEGCDAELRHLAEVAPVFRVRTWQAFLDRCRAGGAVAADTLAEAFVTYRRRRLIPYPEATQVLTRLQQRFRLGIVTNGAPDIQKDKLARAGLTAYFDPVVISGTVGVGKPEPGIFLHALETAAVGPDEAVMIGNNPAHDIAGAKQVGMRTVWVRRTPSQDPLGVTPDDVVPDLAGLVTLFGDAPSTQGAA